MRNLLPGAVLALLVLTSSPAPAAQWRDPYPSTYQPIPSGPVLIQGATVLTGTGSRLEGADVLLSNGRIQAVGVGLQAPNGATIVDGRGKWVTPGIIDVHSHLGVYPSPGVDAHSDGNEASNPTTPNVWAEHSIWPQDPGFATALAGGVTTMQILPGSANLIGGRGVTGSTISLPSSWADTPGLGYTPRCECTSIRPGVTHLPWPSTIVLSGGASSWRPTATTLPFCSSTSASSRRSPVPVSTVAPRNSTGAEGLAR